MNPKDLNSEMLTFFSDRLFAMGIKEGGLENYYKERLGKGAILGELDIYLIDLIRSRYPGNAFIHEMCCGAAQLAHTLWHLGYRTSASELGTKRYRLAVDLGKYIKSGCQIIQGNSFLVDIEADLFVTANAVSTMVRIESNLDFIKNRLSQGSDFIFNADLCGDVCSDNRDILTDAGIKYSELEKGFILLSGSDQHGL